MAPKIETAMRHPPHGGNGGGECEMHAAIVILERRVDEMDEVLRGATGNKSDTGIKGELQSIKKSQMRMEWLFWLALSAHLLDVISKWSAQ